MTTFRRRYFRIDYVRGAEGRTGVGIVEYDRKGKQGAWERNVKAIHSIYDDSNLSISQINRFLFRKIRHDILDANEGALIQFNKYSLKRGDHDAYKPRVIVETMPRVSGLFFHAELLAEDALRRQSTISETFAGNMQFSVVQQEKEEGKIFDGN